jgi:hypothetical protein
VAEDPTDDVLRWEARQGPRAAIAAAVAAVFVIGSGFATAAAFNNAPAAGIADSLARAGRAGGIGGLPSLQTPAFKFYDDHAAVVLLTAVAYAVGLIAIGLMLAYLGAAVRNRSTGFRAVWIYVALAGAILGALGITVNTLTRFSEIGAFLDGPRTVDRAADVGDSTFALVAQVVLGIPGTQAIGLASMALGLGWVVICLNAMRVGLLTRFMGVLGIICGALIVLPVLSALPIVQTFWLGAMTLLLLGRWPNGLPPAWVTGEAQPWPSQQEVREARAARSRGAEPEPQPDPEPAARSGDGRAHPSSRKKKRKRRA